MANDANITLRIDSDDSKAVQGLLSIEQAERKLEVAVKAGNQTLKLRANTEAEIAKILPAVAAAEQRVVTATQKRAAASLAAQKSGVLWANFQKKERDEALATARVLEESAKRARLVQLGKDSMRSASALAEEASFKRTQRRMADMAQAQEKQGGLFGRSAQGAAMFGAGLFGVGSAATAATTAISALIMTQEHQLELARKSDEKATGMKDLVAALPGGAEGAAALKRITGIGAQNGMAPDATAALAAPLYATADKNSDGALSASEQAAFDKNLGAGAMLSSAGVKADDASNVILAGDNKGVGGEETAAKLLKAAAISKRGPAEFSRSASAISQFGDLNTGMAVTTALSAAELNPERLAERTKDAQLSLSSAADESTFSKKHGLKGLTESQKIAKLRAEAAASGDVKKFTDQFKNQGLDEGKAISMGMLIQQGELYGNAETALAGTTSKDLAPQIQKLKDNPLTGSAMRADRAAAMTDANALYGTEGDAARNKRAEALARGAELQQYGGSMAVDSSTGEARPWYDPRAWVGGAQAMVNGMPGTGLNKGGINQSSASGTEKLEASLANLQKSLDANTAATNANSGATKAGGKPVGGAASNAEEKY